MKHVAKGSVAPDRGAAPGETTGPLAHLDEETEARGSSAAPFNDDTAAAPDPDTHLDTNGRQMEELTSEIDRPEQPASMQPAGPGSHPEEPGAGEAIASPGIASGEGESEQARSAATAPQLTGAHLAETITRIDRQLEALRRGPRPFAPSEMHVDEALAEITARQKALEFGPAAPFSGPGSESSSRQIDAAAIDHRLRDLGEQIKALQPGYRFDSVGHDIARDSGKWASSAAIESIEEQLRALTSQMGKAPTPPAVDQLVESLRSDLGEMGRRIEEALPHRTATVLQDQIQAL